MNTLISGELSTTRQDFSQALGLFSPANFNTVPFAGSWTAGQVTEHIYKSIQGAPHLLTGASVHTHRDPAEHVAHLRTMFLDFTTKMKSPDFILPSDAPKDYQSLTGSVTAAFSAVVDASEKIDTSLTILNFEFPGAGAMTRLELLNFISVHTQRHAHQLREIRKRLE